MIRHLALTFLAFSLAWPAVSCAHSAEADGSSRKREIYVNEADRNEPWHAGWADAVVSGDFIFISGVIAALREKETNADLEQAFDRAFARIGKTLEKAGANWDDVVEMTTYMTDVEVQTAVFNKVRLKHMRPPYAASTVVQVPRLIPRRGIAEIRVTAHKQRSAAVNSNASPTKWINGKWFDGTGFAEATFYSDKGLLTTTALSGDVKIVDLGGKYVVPAFGDAHHHGIDREEGLEQKIAAFLRDGIFYVKNPNVIPQYLTPAMRRKINRPDSIDVVFSNGGLTGSTGHPGPLHDKLAARGVFPGMQSGDMEGRAYFYVDSEKQLAAKWPAILAGKPDFIKTFLNGSEAILRDGHKHGSERGLEPAVLRAVVKHAHAAGLRVSTHVDTAGDFAVAIEAGVDEINHMPRSDQLNDREFVHYLIDPAVAAATAQQRTFVVATASVGPRFRQAKWSGSMLESFVANQRTNLRVLQTAGVRIAIGSDGISGETPFVTTKDEIDYLLRHKLADNLTLLKMWAENTPATIFPGRRIGRLADGYEANFLVLEGNPLVDFGQVGRIGMRVKAGNPL